MFSFLIALLLAAPVAVTADPPADAAHPAAMADFVLDSHGSGINAVLYTASGAGTHPTLLLLHGFPGNEQNLDLAQAARRAGWNVLTLHYRGSWGSKGDFSFGHSVEDAQSALDWLRAPANAATYRIDPARIVVAGHSMGGFVAVETVVANPGLAGVALIDAWNIGRYADDMARDRTGAASFMTANLPPLAGITAVALVDEAIAHRRDWNLLSEAAALARRPLFIAGATRGGAKDNGDLAAAVRSQPRARVTATTLPTDHSFSDHRIALATALMTWLETIK